MEHDMTERQAAIVRVASFFLLLFIVTPIFSSVNDGLLPKYFRGSIDRQKLDSINSHFCGTDKFHILDGEFYAGLLWNAPYFLTCEIEDFESNLSVNRHKMIRFKVLELIIWPELDMNNVPANAEILQNEFSIGNDTEFERGGKYLMHLFFSERSNIFMVDVVRVVQCINDSTFSDKNNAFRLGEVFTTKEIREKMFLFLKDKH